MKQPRHYPKTPPNADKKLARLWAAAAFAVTVTIAAFLVPPLESRSPKPVSPLDPTLGVLDTDAGSRLTLREQSDHPVTREMELAAQHLGGRRGKDFELRDENGKTQTFASLSQGKPVVLFFIEKECPCCLGAKYFVDRLADIHHDTAVVVGVINATGKEADLWRQTTRPKFKVLEDPNQTAIRAFSAERGVYTTLLRPDGTIEKAYPGYSRAMLNELSRRISKLANVEDRPYISTAAPERMTSGCVFPELPKETTKP